MRAIELQASRGRRVAFTLGQEARPGGGPQSSLGPDSAGHAVEWTMRDLRVTSIERFGVAFMITIIGTIPMGLIVCAIAEGSGIARILIYEERLYSVAIPVCMGVAWCWLLFRDQREQMAALSHEKLNTEEQRRNLRRDLVTQALKESRITSGARLFASLAFTYMGPWPISVVVLDRMRPGQAAGRSGVNWTFIAIMSACSTAIWCILLWMDHRRLRAAEEDAE